MYNSFLLIIRDKLIPDLHNNTSVNVFEIKSRVLLFDELQ